MRIFVFLSFLALQGCAGVEMIHDRTVHYDSTSPGVNYRLLDRGQYAFYEGGKWIVTTKEELREHWGEPDAKSSDGKFEKWRYYRNVSWVVLMPELIVPLPLGVPTGHSGVTFTLQGSKIISADADEMYRGGLSCGYLVFGIGCITGEEFHGIDFFGASP